MKTNLLHCCLLACFLLAGCGGTTTHETLTASKDDSAVIELTEEDALVLESMDVPVDDEAPVTKENYEDALKQLEEEIDEDQ